MTHIHHDYASFVPGFYQGFYRLGYWRWVRYPEYFNHKHSASATELFVHWIDEDRKREILEAREAGIEFPPSITVYDRWKD